MPFGWVSAGLAIYNTLNSSGSSGSSSGSPGAMTYVPTGQGNADNMWQQIMQHWSDISSGDTTALTDYLHGGLSSAEGAIPGIQGRMNNFGDELTGMAGRFTGREGALTGAGESVWNTALDPEGALRDRTQQRVVDASRAATSARGIGMGGESAGLEDQAVSNFNLDWNDRQLGREVSGAQALTGTSDAAGRQAQGAEGAYTGATNFYQNAYQLPFNLASTYGSAMGTSVYNPMNALGGNLAQYMGLGQSASQAAFGQNQTNMNNLTSGLNQFAQSPWLQSYFNTPSNWSGGSYTSNPSDIGYYGSGDNYGAGAGP